jgi:hypothetical protein
VSKKKLTPLLFKLAAKVSVFFYSPCILIAAISAQFLVIFFYLSRELDFAARKKNMFAARKKNMFSA